MVSQKEAMMRAILRKAREVKDPLKELVTAFWQCDTNSDGLVQFRSYHARDMPKELQDWCLAVCRENMAELYERVWSWSDTKKRKQLASNASRFLIAHDGAPGRTPLAYVNYRFEQEEGEPVLYCYELQVVRQAQSRGLGRTLMDLTERIAWASDMQKVMLTVFCENTAAVSFYRKLGYRLDETSPDYCGEEGGGGGGEGTSGAGGTPGDGSGGGGVGGSGSSNNSGGDSQASSACGGAGYLIMSKRAPASGQQEKHPQQQQQQRLQQGQEQQGHEQQVCQELQPQQQERDRQRSQVQPWYQLQPQHLAPRDQQQGQRRNEQEQDQQERGQQEQGKRRQDQQQQDQLQQQQHGHQQQDQRHQQQQQGPQQQDQHQQVSRERDQQEQLKLAQAQGPAVQQRRPDMGPPCPLAQTPTEELHPTSAKRQRADEGERSPQQSAAAGTGGGAEPAAPLGFGERDAAGSQP